MDGRQLLRARDTKTALYTTLKRYNAFAAAVHGISFVASLVMVITYNTSSFDAELTWDPRVYAPNATLDRVRTTGPYTTKPVTVGYVRLAWVQIWFPFITACFHTYIARNTYTVYASVFDTRSNPLRWIEYSITASFMTCIIAQIAGITNIFLIIEIGVIDNILLQYLGYMVELRIADAVRAKASVFYACVSVLACAWALFTWQWASILVYFYHAVNSREPPLFVYLVVLILLGFYMSFGAIHAWYARTVSLNSQNAEQRYIIMEKSFIIASLVSKLSLEWILIYGLVTNGMASTDT